MVEQSKTSQFNSDHKEAVRIQQALGLESVPNLKIFHPNVKISAEPDPLPEYLKVEAINNDLSPEQSFIRSHLDLYFGQHGYDIAALEGKKILAPTPFVGWGHLVQIAELSQTLSNVTKTNVYMCDPMDFLSESEQRPYRTMQDFLKVMHSGGDMSAYIESIDDGVTTLGDKLFYGSAKNLMRICLGGAGYTGPADDNLISKISQNVVGAIGKNKGLSKFLLQSIVAAEVLYTEKPFGKLIHKMSDIVKPDIVISSHSATIRSLSEANPKEKIPAISFIPDPGYFSVISEIIKSLDPRDPNSRDLIKEFQLLVPFAPWSKKFMPFNDNLVFTVPSETAKEELIDMYDPNAYIVPAGTITGTIEPIDFARKWNNPQRNILLSSNGNGSNIPTIYRALRDFVNADRESTGQFNLTIFFGEHSDEKIGPEMLALLDVVKNDAYLANKISVVRTTNRLDTAIQKNLVTKTCHAQFRTGGENAMDNANMGCASINTWNDAENEAGNVFFMMQKDAALPSAWPPEDYQKWKDKLGPVLKAQHRRIPHFEQLQENFVSYINKLFGPEEIARKIATKGYLNLDNLSNMHMIMLITQMMLNRITPKKPEDMNRITPEQIQSIENYMEPVRNNWEQKRRAILHSEGII